MHFTGPTYRPPYEATSLILQATAGCSHNACAFCSMYRNIEFAASPLEEIEEDLASIAHQAHYVSRVFLANGDPFCLPAERLLEIARLAHAYLPYLETIGSYASVRNVAAKTDEELRALAEAGYADLNIGLESGLDDVLAHLNKGFTVDEARSQLARLHAAGLPFNVNIIVAAAGFDRALEHAHACAQLVNEVDPTLVFVSPLHIDPGTPLADELAQELFNESTIGLYISEELEFLRGLELDDAVFYGLHMSNPVQLAGRLPRDKAELMETLADALRTYPPRLLDSHPIKGREGRIIG